MQRRLASKAFVIVIIAATSVATYYALSALFMEFPILEESPGMVFYLLISALAVSAYVVIALRMNNPESLLGLTVATPLLLALALLPFTWILESLALVLVTIALPTVHNRDKVHKRIPSDVTSVACDIHSLRYASRT